MKHLVKHLGIAFTALILVAGCGRDATHNLVKGTVAFYLIDTFARVDSTAQIDPASVVTEPDPLVKYMDLLAYKPDKHTFIVSNRARSAVLQLDHSLYGTPFAVKANDSLVYTGYFWPGYSSASCNWIVIDPIMLDMTNEMKVNLGYPGPMEEHPIPDKRNDPRILQIFKRDHKLIR